MSKVSWNDRKARILADRGTTRGLTAAAEHVLGESRKQVPIEEATLERSGATDVDDDQASIFYDTEYAVVQHEDLDNRHDPGRKAKYLEEPLNASKRDVERILAQEMRGAF